MLYKRELKEDNETVCIPQKSTHLEEHLEAVQCMNVSFKFYLQNMVMSHLEMNLEFYTKINAQILAR